MMHRINKWTFLYIAGLLLPILGCPKTPTEPPPPPPPPAGPDTTSHDFTWTIDTLGDGNSSVLYDVAIINDTTVWAVGEIFLKDSSGQIDPSVYGLAKWNGGKWSYHRVPYHDFGTTQAYPGPLFAVQAFGLNDMFVCSYANLLHWDGSTWSEKAFFMTAIPFENQIQKMWGSTGYDLYCVGRKGGIFHFDGTSWTKIESGTMVAIQDIWGTTDPATAVRTILCASSSTTPGTERKLLRISESSVVDTVSWSPGRQLNSVWFLNPDRLFVAGDGVFLRGSDQAWNELTELPPIYTRRIRGNALNDVFVAGDFGYLSHWNGASWRYYTDHDFPSFYGSWASVAVRGDLVVAVGLIGDAAGILIGRRR